MKIEDGENERIPYEGDEIPIVIFVPENTYKIDFTVNFIDKNGEPHEAYKTYLPDGVNQARQNYLEVDPDGDSLYRYVLTENGKELLNEIE